MIKPPLSSVFLHVTRAPLLLPTILALACDAKPEAAQPAATPAATPEPTPPPTEAPVPTAKPSQPPKPVPPPPPEPTSIEHFVAPAPANAPVAVAQRMLVVPGGNVLTDPIGTIVATRADYWSNTRRLLLHVELDTVAYTPADAEIPNDAWSPIDVVLLSAAGERHLKVIDQILPVLVAGTWYYADERRLLKMSADKPTGKRVATLPGEIEGLVAHHDSLFVLHDREIVAADVEIGDEAFADYQAGLHEAENADAAEAEGVPNHHEPDLSYAMNRVISRIPLKGGKPKLVLDRHDTIDVWTIGGSSSSVIAWHEGGGSVEYLELVAYSEKNGDYSRPADEPGTVYVLDLAVGGAPRDVLAIARGANRPIHGLAIDQSHLYWFESREGKRRALCRKPWATEAPTEDLAWADELCTGCTPYLHAGYVYWDGLQQVRRMPIGGGPIETLAIASQDPATLRAMPRTDWRPFTPPGIAK